MLEDSLIIGGSGMVGQNITFGLKPRSSDLNILNKESIKKYMSHIKPPTCIIHLAALNIRDCERNPSDAIKINIDGTINMLNVAKQLNIPFVFFSSGAVFSSPLSSMNFTENMEMNPNCIYGDTKKTAEEIVNQYDKSIIIRTGWLFGGIQKTHNKFVELTINNLVSNVSVKGSNDFYGSPTYTSDLIEKMVFLIENKKYGVHHIVNSGYACGYEIAVEVASILQKPHYMVESVSATNVPNSSPNRSASECLETIYEFNKLRSWKCALNDYIIKYIDKINTPVILPEIKDTLWKTREICRLCNSYKLHTFFKLEDTPPANHFISEIRHQEKIPLTLAKCIECNHVQLLEIIDPKYLYSNYLYLSAVSKSMTKHLQNSVHDFVRRFEIKDTEHILEIASNDGTCIKELLRLGYMNTIGVDPAQNINKMHSLPILCDYFGSGILTHERIINKKFKLIFGFHCCAHIENIQDVFSTVYKLLDDDGVFIIEVGYFKEVVRQSNFDVIYHEHIDYHTCYAMNNFAKLNNMQVFDVSKNNIQNGSIQFYMSKCNVHRNIAKSVQETIQDEIDNKIFDIEYLNMWKSDIIKSGNEFYNLMSGLVLHGKTIAGYGASAKSTTFLHQYKMDTSIIKYIIDDNYLKQNKYSPGLHIPIKSREHIINEPVEYIIILSWNFTDDIIKQLVGYIENKIRIIVPFPRFRII